MSITLLIGGARSGKSRFAVDLGRRHEAGGGTVRFVATAPRIAGDPDWSRRIARHVADRPAWPTVEAPTDITSALAGAGDGLVIVDCLTLWVSNLLHAGHDADSIISASEDFAGAARTRSAPTVVVTNEVGLGIHPDTELGRSFRDVLGTVNQRVATTAGRTLLFVAGRAIALQDPVALLEEDLP